MRSVVPPGMRDRLALATATIRRILGMPNYAAYVAHLRERHPGCTVPDEREYYEAYLKQRYEGGATRCC